MAFLDQFGDVFNNLVENVGDELGGKSKEEIAQQQLANQAAAIAAIQSSQKANNTFLYVMLGIGATVLIGGVAYLIWTFSKQKSN